MGGPQRHCVVGPPPHLRGRRTHSRRASRRSRRGPHYRTSLPPGCSAARGTSSKGVDKRLGRPRGETRPPAYPEVPPVDEHDALGHAAQRERDGELRRRRCALRRGRCRHVRGGGQVCAEPDARRVRGRPLRRDGLPWKRVRRRRGVERAGRVARSHPALPPAQQRRVGVGSRGRVGVGSRGRVGSRGAHLRRRGAEHDGPDALAGGRRDGDGLEPHRCDEDRDAEEGRAGSIFSRCIDAGCRTRGAVNDKDVSLPERRRAEIRVARAFGRRRRE